MFGGGGGGGGSSMFGQEGSDSNLPFDVNKEYDLVVIGGGTGGISCA